MRVTPAGGWGLTPPVALIEWPEHLPPFSGKDVVRIQFEVYATR
jgi:hypothetical protein